MFLVVITYHESVWEFEIHYPKLKACFLHWRHQWSICCLEDIMLQAKYWVYSCPLSCCTHLCTSVKKQHQKYLRTLKHFLAWTVTVGQSETSPSVNCCGCPPCSFKSLSLLEEDCNSVKHPNHHPILRKSLTASSQWWPSSDTGVWGGLLFTILTSMSSLCVFYGKWWEECLELDQLQSVE